MRTVKCVIVGDEDVDKRELFLQYTALLNAEAETASAIEEDGSNNDVSRMGISSEGKEQQEVLVDGDKDVEGEDGSNKSHPHFQVIHLSSEKESISSVESLQDSIDHWSGVVTVLGKHYLLDLRDAHCENAYDNIRPDMYSDTDVFLVCFSVVRSISWENALNKWIPEIQKHCPVIPFILVGTQTEWRELWDERDASKKPVSPVTGAGYAQQVGAVKYLEFSAGDYEVREVFNAAVLISVMDKVTLSTFHPDFDKEGSNLIHRAAKRNHVPSLETVVDFIDVNTKDKAFHTPIDVAIKENSLDAVRFLLESGCEFPNPPDPWRKRCEFWLSDEDEDSEHVVNSNITEFTRQVTFFLHHRIAPPTRKDPFHWSEWNGSGKLCERDRTHASGEVTDYFKFRRSMSVRLLADPVLLRVSNDNKLRFRLCGATRDPILSSECEKLVCCQMWRIASV